jgi:hypothetical protein
MVSLLTDDARINSIIFGTYFGKDGATEIRMYNDSGIMKKQLEILKDTTK